MKTKSVLQFFITLLLVLTTLLFLVAEADASPPYAEGDFSWARSMGGTGYESGADLVIDSNGNIYITGYFQGTVDFDPGVGVANLTSNGFSDIFVSKLDGNGDLVWAKSIDGLNGNAITVDSSDNVYITGDFSGTVDFDPNAGIFNLTARDSASDIFVLKLNNDGDFLWAKSMESMGEGWNSSMSFDITVDSSGNVYTTGYFCGTVDFDPGTGSYNLTCAGDADIFVSKLDSSGNFVWAKSIGWVWEDVGVGIAVDSEGNVYTTGTFLNTVDFDPGTGTFNLTSVGREDIFVSKLDSNGNFVWAKNMGGTGYDGTSSINLDSIGNIYITGVFENTADFDPGIDTFNLTSAGGLDVFISKLDGNGDFSWAKSMGGPSFDGGNSVVDSNGNVYTTCCFQGTADFDPGIGVSNLTSVGGIDIYISKLNNNGEYVWAKSMGGADSDFGRIALDTIGNIYLTGSFEGVVDLDPGVGTFNLTSVGGSDIFVVKLLASSSNLPPAANAGGPYTAFSGETITLDASGSSDPDGNPLTYEWDLDMDGEYDDALGVTADIALLDVGTFTVGLQVTDPDGLSDTDTADVTVNPVPISIDVKPGAYPNPINLGAKGVIPVVVLTTDEFDASSLDPVTVIFAGASPLRWVLQDVDWDGDIDLLLHFKTLELDLGETSTEAVLTGETFDGIFVGGGDSVKIVPAK